MLLVSEVIFAANALVQRAQLRNIKRRGEGDAGAAAANKPAVQIEIPAISG
jgi:hypothetical protein